MSRVLLTFNCFGGHFNRDNDIVGGIYSLAIMFEYSLANLTYYKSGINVIRYIVAALTQTARLNIYSENHNGLFSQSG